MLVAKAYILSHVNNFSSLLNTIFKDAEFPETLKVSKVILVRKPGKTAQDISCFRPISLVPSFSKVIEHIILRRLEDFLNLHNLMHPRQFGFRRHKSANDLQYNLLSEVRGLRSSGKHVLILAIDISGAFDCAWHSQIIYQLIEWRCPRYLIDLIASYLGKRTAMVEIQQRMHYISTERGCPQGSVLGPTLWNVSINHILADTLEHISKYAYADDFFFVIDGDTENLMLKNAETALANVVSRLETIKLNVNIKKTKFLVINSKRKQYNINFGNHKIPFSEDLGILGVVYDRKLSFRQHFSLAIQKTAQLNNMIRCLKNNFRGAQCYNLQTLYEACIIPKLTYGSAIWYPILKFKVWQRKVDSLHRKIACNLLNAFKTVSTNAANILLGKLPLRYAILENSSRYLVLHNHSPTDEQTTQLQNPIHFGESCKTPITDRFQKVRDPNNLRRLDHRIYIRSTTYNEYILVGIAAFEHRQLRCAKLISFDRSYTINEIDELATLFVMDKLALRDHLGSEVITEHPSLVEKVSRPQRGCCIANSIRNIMVSKNIRLTYKNDSLTNKITDKLHESMLANANEAQLFGGYSTKRREKSLLRTKMIEL